MPRKESFFRCSERHFDVIKKEVSGSKRTGDSVIVLYVLIGLQRPLALRSIHFLLFPSVKARSGGFAGHLVSRLQLAMDLWQIWISGLRAEVMCATFGLSSQWHWILTLILFTGWAVTIIGAHLGATWYEESRPPSPFQVVGWQRNEFLSYQSQCIFRSFVIAA